MARRGSDCSPAADCESTDPSIFAQLEAAGLSWKSYAESMPVELLSQDAGRVRTAPQSGRLLHHTTAPSCKKFDVPMGTTAQARWRRTCRGGSLPATASSHPTSATTDTTHAAGSRPGGRGGSIHGAWMPRIARLAGLQERQAHGGTDSRHVRWRRSQQPSRHDRERARSCPHTRVSTADFDHYSLLRMTEDLTGLAHTTSERRQRSRHAARPSALASRLSREVDTQERCPRRHRTPQTV